MIYSNNKIQVLTEKSETEVKFSVAIEKFKKWFLGQEMDTKKIDKLIHDIKSCNDKIAEYRKDPHNKCSRENLEKDNIYWQKILKELLWVYPAAFAVSGTVAMSSVLGIIVSGMFMLLVKSRFSEDTFLNNIESENNKALKWLKEEKDTIDFKKSRKETNHESTIFESVKLI